MPKKNAAGKCGSASCCGSAGICWDCNVPQSVTVGAGSGGSGSICCTPEEGTYTFPEGTPFVRCFPVFGPIWNGHIVEGNVLSGGCCPYTIVEPWDGSIGSNIRQYTCLIDQKACSGGASAHIFLKKWQGNALSLTMSGKTINAVIRTIYEWVRSFTGLGGTCGFEHSYVEIVDNYSRTFTSCTDVVDGVEITHTSRVRSDVNIAGTFGGTGDEIIWGPTGDRRSYFVCAPKVLTLNMP